MHTFLRTPLVIALLGVMLVTLFWQSHLRNLACRDRQDVALVTSVTSESLNAIADLREEVKQMRRLLEEGVGKSSAPAKKGLEGADGQPSKTGRAAQRLLQMQSDGPELQQQKLVPSAIAGTHIGPPSPAQKKFLLVGLFTVPEKLQRRALIRATYLRLKPANVDFLFVFGTPSKPEHLRLLQWENEQHGDILILDSEENMDDGKTFHYFSHVGNRFADRGYEFVMKTDDDVWLHLPNLERRVQAFPKTGGVFFGREVNEGAFMAGMGYLLSWDIVRWIATDPFPVANTVGQEDAVLARWLHHGRQVVHWISENEEFYDDPSFQRGWAHNYTEGTILIHRLKDEVQFVRASAHFLDAPIPPAAILAPAAVAVGVS